MIPMVVFQRRGNAPPILVFSPIVSVKNNIQNTFTAEGDVGECSICQEIIKKGDIFKRLPCSSTVNHCFHANCVAQWFQNNSTCPNCRATVK